MTLNTEQLVYTINETAQLLRIGRSKLYILINEGKLPVVKLGKRVLVKRTDVETLLISLPARTSR
jgi:excisionase family DNA binding protein